MAIQPVGIGLVVNDGGGDPLRTAFSKINDNFADPTNAASKLVGTASDNISTNSDLQTYKNLLINSNFAVNQREVSGLVVLAAGEYGHDRFKAGAGGCSYTFATLSGVTTITITAGTLMQAVDGASIPATDLALSWTGTSQGRINAGAYGVSGAVTGATLGGVNFTAEFDTGTLANTKLEKGLFSTPFSTQGASIGEELDLCQRYLEDIQVNGQTGVNAAYAQTISFQPKGGIPDSITLQVLGLRNTISTVTVQNITDSTFNLVIVPSGAGFYLQNEVYRIEREL